MKERYYHTKASVKEYIQLAQDVSSAPLIEKFKTYLPKGSSVLEIGSGPGTDWNILQKHFEVTGSDNSAVFVDHLQNTFPEGSFLLLDAVTLDTAQTFDGLYSNKVLHHLTDSDLQNSIQRQAEILPPGTIISHSFWKGEGTENFKGMFVNYHMEKEIRSLFAPFFDILLLESYKEFEEGDSVYLLGKKRA